MPLHGGPTDRREGSSPAAGNAVSGGGNGVLAGDSSRPGTIISSQRLRLNPNKDHKPDIYEDLQLEFSPSIFSSLERYMPPTMLSVPRDDKVIFMREILLKYLPPGEQNRVCFLFGQKFPFLINLHRVFGS